MPWGKILTMPSDLFKQRWFLFCSKYFQRCIARLFLHVCICVCDSRFDVHWNAIEIFMAYSIKKGRWEQKKKRRKKKQQQNSENNKTIRIDFECVLLLEMRLLHVHWWPPMLPTYISTCIYIALHPRFILFQFGVRESGRWNEQQQHTITLYKLYCDACIRENWARMCLNKIL